MKDRGLTCGIEDDEFVIRIGVDTLTDAAIYDLNIVDRELFIKDLVREINFDISDSRVTEMLEQCFKDVIDSGSESVEYF